MSRIYIASLKQLRRGVKIILATVVRTTGSTPQKPGSSAVFGEGGLLAGTVGGGILEEEVRHIAESVRISGISDHYFFNLDEEPDEEGAICGGNVLVLVDADLSKHLKPMEAMERTLNADHGGWLLTILFKKQGEGKTIKRYWIPEEEKDSLPVGLDTAVKEAVLSHCKSDDGTAFSALSLPSHDESQIELAFMEHIRPLPRLVIAGAGHIGKAVAHLGSILDFETTVIDDRPEFANRDQIPDADHLIVKEIGEAMEELKFGAETYVVIVTRGHHHDAEALKPCIGSGAAYVGMIGSSNKVRVLKDRFIRNGWATPEQWSEIHTPIGLPIGSKSVQEIAISIAAELVQVRHQQNKNKVLEK